MRENSAKVQHIVQKYTFPKYQTRLESAKCNSWTKVLSLIAVTNKSNISLSLATNSLHHFNFYLTVPQKLHGIAIWMSNKERQENSWGKALSPSEE